MQTIPIYLKLYALMPQTPLFTASAADGRFAFTDCSVVHNARPPEKACAAHEKIAPLAAKIRGTAFRTW
jgi:hypothetical protein